MECNYCKKECTKSGLTKNHIQRYYCSSCVKYQQRIYLYKGCKPYISKKVELLSNESCGIRSISRILRISKGKVLKTIKELYREKLQQRRIILRGREYELDEMKTYIGSKNKKYWIVYAIDRVTRAVIDFKVGKRNNKTLGKVIETLLLSGAKRIYTD